MNKEQIGNLIDKLSDKTLSFGCLVTCGTRDAQRILDKRVFSGDAGKCRYKISAEGDGWIEEDSLHVIGHPILIGDILEKMKEETEEIMSKKSPTDEDRRRIEILYLAITEDILELWGECGFTKSLQEIVESGWEETVEMSKPYTDENGNKITGAKVYFQLKEPARALLEFLNGIFK